MHMHFYAESTRLDQMFLERFWHDIDVRAREGNCKEKRSRLQPDGLASEELADGPLCELKSRERKKEMYGTSWSNEANVGIQLVEQAADLSREDVKTHTQEPAELVVTLAAKSKPWLLGQSTYEQAVEQEWLSKALMIDELQRAGTILPESRVAALDAALDGKTYLLGNKSVSVADLLIYPLVARSVQTLPPKRQLELANATRWCMLMRAQHDPRRLVSFDGVPRPTFQKPPPLSERELASTAQAKRSVEANDDGKKQTKAQEREQKQQQNKPSSSTAPDKFSSAEAPSGANLDIRCGNVKSCKPHDSADALWVLDVDTGEENERQIVAGLRNFKSKQELEGATVVVWCNLKPSNLKGVRSEGVVLCASNSERTEPLRPPQSATVGSRIAVSGFEQSAVSVTINPKKKEHEKYVPYLRTDDTGKAVYADTPLVLVDAPEQWGCTAPLSNASVG